MPVIPVLHATSEESAKSICKTGFATLCTLDAGLLHVSPLRLTLRLLWARNVLYH